MKKSVEEKVVAIGLLIFGLASIAIGMFLIKAVFPAIILAICGTVLDVYALQYLSKKGK